MLDIRRIKEVHRLRRSRHTATFPSGVSPRPGRGGGWRGGGVPAPDN